MYFNQTEIRLCIKFWFELAFFQLIISNFHVNVFISFYSWIKYSIFTFPTCQRYLLHCFPKSCISSDCLLSLFHPNKIPFLIIPWPIEEIRLSLGRTFYFPLFPCCFLLASFKLVSLSLSMKSLHKFMLNIFFFWLEPLKDNFVFFTLCMSHEKTHNVPLVDSPWRDYNPWVPSEFH